MLGITRHHFVFEVQVVHVKDVDVAAKGLGNKHELTMLRLNFLDQVVALLPDFSEQILEK